ncbi:MAG TPA: Ig-like domain-containing protein, partial [Gemmatimonadales bacterium]
MVIGVGVSTCRIGDLVTVPEGGLIYTIPGPDQGADSVLNGAAAVGSTAPQVMKIYVGHTGKGQLDWNAKVGGGSAWLTIANKTGTAGDSIVVVGHPDPLTLGSHRDSIVVTSSTGGVVVVPVKFQIVPCDTIPLTSSGDERTDTLTTADCAATHHPGTQVQLYSFSGAANEEATILLSSRFNGWLAFDTSLTGPPDTTATDCQGDTKSPCLYYVRLPRQATYIVEVSGATGSDTGQYTIRLLRSTRHPNAPDSLSQRATDSVAIPVGDTVRTTSILFRAVVSDSDVVDSLHLEVEALQLSQSFTGTATAPPGPKVGNGQPAWVLQTGLIDGKAYHWCVRAVDQQGGRTNCLSFGGNLESDTDFIVSVGNPPKPPTNLQQLQGNGTTVIAVGDTATATTVKFTGQVSDPDAGSVLNLEVEVQPTDTAFLPGDSASDNQTFTSAGSGGTATATIIAPTLTNGKDYHWRARTRDNTSRFSSWVSFPTPTPNAETATDFHVTVKPSFNLVFTVPPSQTVAGVAMMPAVQVTAQNEFGQTITSFTGNVTMTVASGPPGGVFAPGATTTVAANAGVATFSNLIINKAGSGYTLVATSGTTNSPASNSFAIVPAPATQLVFTVEPPASATAGVPFAPAIQVAGEDQFFNVNSGFTGQVTMAIGTNGGNPPGTLRGTKQVNASNGVAGFSTLNIDKIGNGYTLNASASGLANATSSQIDITAAPVTHLVFAVQPSTTAAGLIITPAVNVAGRDSLENTVPSFTSNVTVAIGTNPGNGTLGGTTTVAASSGIASFSTLTINKVGTNYTLNAISGALPPVTSAFFDIVTSTVDSVNSTVTATTPITACGPPLTCTTGGGTASSITITVLDGNNNPVVGAPVTLSATGASVAITQPAPTDASGMTTGTIASDSAGVKVVTAVANGVGIATHPSVTVNPGPAVSLLFSTQPTPTGAGAAINSGTGVRITAKDQFGNTATSFTSTVTMSIAAPPGGVFAPTSTNTAPAASGVATFSNLRIYTAGPGYQLQASGGSLTSPPSNAFAITVGPAVRDTFNVQPATTAVLDTIQKAIGGMKVWITDSVGNLVTTDNTHTITMTFFSNPTGATLGGSQVRTVSGGVATFNDLTINKLGTYQLNAVSNLSGNPTDISVPFNIIPGPAKTLVFKTQPSATVAGVAISPAVRVAALDIAGDTATGFNGPVTMSLNPASGNLGGTLTVNAVAGQATFSNLTVAVAGTYTLTAAAGGSITNGTSSSFQVVSGGVSASQSQVSATSPITACSTSCTTGAGTASLITVTAKDNLGNPIAGATVTLQATVGTANTITQPSGTTGANGQITGTLSSTLAESKTVQATITAGGNPGVVINQTATIVVNPAAATVLVFTKQPPASVTAGAAITPAVQVEVRDAFANKVTTASNQVTLSFIQSGRGPLNNNVAGAVGGVATFSGLNATQSTTGLTLDSLLASATGLTPDTSTGFAVNAATPSASVSTVTASPTTITTCQTGCTTGGGTASLITVTAKDQFGNGVSGANITLTISGTGNTTSPVSLNQTANSSGVAQWTLNSTTAEGKTISATANSVGITQTATVTVNSSGVSASQSTVSAVPASITACSASCTTGAGTASLITVTAKDQFGNRVSNASVTLSVAGSNNTLVPASLTQTANGSGVATWTLNSSAVEAKTISATA